MSIIVNTNMSSLITQRYLSQNNSSLQNIMEKLSSGCRITAAKDDAAGLSIAQGLTTQIRGNTKALENIEDGMNLISTAETGMSTATEHLQRIRELCVQGANEIFSTDQKQAIANEIMARLDELQRLTGAINYNGTTLLDGSCTSLILQIGSGTDAATNTLDIAQALTDIHPSSLGVTTNIFDDLATLDNAAFRGYMDSIDIALETVNISRSKIGAFSNAMDSAKENLTTVLECNTDSKSRIMDVDVAAASSDMLKYQILQQTSTSLLAQANQLPSVALSLLGG